MPLPIASFTAALVCWMLLGADIPAAPAQEGPESPIDVKGLVTEVLPTAYPRLIACLREHGSLRAADGAVAGYRLSPWERTG